MRGDSLLLLLNGGGRGVAFALPSEGGRWVALVDTAQAGERPVRRDQVMVSAHSLVLLRYEREG